MRRKTILAFGLFGCLIGIESVGISAQTAASQPVTAAELDAIAQRVKSFRPRDEFDAPPSSPSMEGRRFSFTVTPLRTGPDNVICDGSPTWGYWQQDGRLEVGATEALAMKADFRSGSAPLFASDAGGRAPFVTFGSFRCQKTRLPSYMANNAFGAQFEIFPSREVVTAIGDFGDVNTSWRTYWSTQISGDPARQLSQNIRVRLSGVLSDWGPGRPVVCGTKRDRPRADSPFEESLEICLFRGQFDLFEVIDARSGEVLFSSPRQTRH